MKINTAIWSVLAAVACMWALNASALDITIFDGSAVNASGWYGPQEDQEVEHPSNTGQQWDLEAFNLVGGDLQMIGGYNFITGVQGFDSGDIFIDVDGDAIYGQAAMDLNMQSGNGVISVPNVYNWDYVFDVNWSGGTWDLYSLGPDSLLSVYYDVNEESNPWRLADGNPGGALDSGAFAQTGPLSDAQILALYGIGRIGGTHFHVGGFDLSSIPEFSGGYQDLTAHFTQECGNDNLIGTFPRDPTNVPDGGMTVMLLGIGFASMALVGLRMRNRR